MCITRFGAFPFWYPCMPACRPKRQAHDKRHLHQYSLGPFFMVFCCGLYTHQSPIVHVFESCEYMPMVIQKLLEVNSSAILTINQFHLRRQLFGGCTGGCTDKGGQSFTLRISALSEVPKRHIRLSPRKSDLPTLLTVAKT